MLGVLPLLAALTQPLPRQSDDVCKKPEKELSTALDVEVQRVSAIWQLAPGGVPWFVVSPACKWRCDGGNPAPSHVLGILRYTCYDSAFQLGLGAPDREIHDATHARHGGRMMKVPDSLIKASLDFPKVDDFKKELARLGYRYLDFTSTSVPNPPAGYARVLILVEGEDFDQWFQIATMDTVPRTLSRNVDLSVVEKRDEQGRKLSPTNFYMNGYSRFPLPTPRWEQEGLGSTHGLNRCIMCHPSGLRGIYPRPGSVAPEEQATLKYIQKKLDSTTASAFGGYYDPTQLGPPVGPVDPPTRPALVARCAAGLPEASKQRVARAMNCSSCHDGQDRGLLHAGTDWSTIQHKIVGATPEGIMPPGESLTTVERIVTNVCLRMEYSEQFKAWLKGPRGTAKSP